MLNSEYRLYDPRLAQWLTRDPVFQPWESPYSAMAGNPILFSDPLGDTPGTETQTQHVTEFSDGGTQTNPQALTEQNGNNITVGSNGALTTTGASGMKTDKKTNTSSTKSATVSSVTSSESTLIIHADPQGALSAGKELVSTDKKEISPLPFMENDKRIVSDQTSAKVNDFYFPDDICADCTNPGTIGGNIFWGNYTGDKNPKSWNGKDTYEPTPQSLSDYSGIGHDKRYDNLEIRGGSGLFTDSRAIGADIQFVAEELLISELPGLDPLTKLKARAYSLGLYAMAAPKILGTAIGLTYNQFVALTQGRSSVSFFWYVSYWYDVSNTNDDGSKVTNLPENHIHDPIN